MSNQGEYLEPDRSDWPLEGEDPPEPEPSEDNPDPDDDEPDAIADDGMG